MPNGCKAGKRAFFRPSYNQQVCPAVRAKPTSGVSSPPLQPSPGSRPQDRPGREGPTVGLQGPGFKLLRQGLPVTMPELEGALSSSISASATYPGGKRGPAKEGCLPRSYSHISQLPAQILFRQQAAASLPRPLSHSAHLHRQAQALAHPAWCSLTRLLKFFPLPRMPALPFGPSKLLLIHQGPVQISSSLTPQVMITPMWGVLTPLCPEKPTW